MSKHRHLQQYRRPRSPRSKRAGPIPEDAQFGLWPRHRLVQMDQKFMRAMARALNPSSPARRVS
jgi:hypothetical protein